LSPARPIFIYIPAGPTVDSVIDDIVPHMEAAYRNEEGLDKIPAYVDDTGEVNWLVDDAMHMEVSVPVIAQAVMQLISSRDNDKLWARAVTMMRHGFGGHKYGHDLATVRERRQGQISDFIRD